MSLTVATVDPQTHESEAHVRRGRGRHHDPGVYSLVPVLLVGGSVGEGRSDPRPHKIHE